MLGNIEGRRRGGHQRMRWLDSITDTMNMNMGKLQEMRDMEARLQRVRHHRVTEQQQVSWSWILQTSECCHHRGDLGLLGASGGHEWASSWQEKPSPLDYPAAGLFPRSQALGWEGTAKTRPDSSVRAGSVWGPPRRRPRAARRMLGAALC